MTERKKCLCHLEPTGLGKEYMQAIDIDLGCDSTIVLGRNAITGLNSMTANNIQFVSRNHAEVHIKGGTISLKPTSKQPKWVYKNGNLLRDGEFENLIIGDVITLLGRLNYFSYQLVAGAKISDPTVPTDIISSPKRVAKKAKLSYSNDDVTIIKIPSNNSVGTPSVFSNPITIDDSADPIEPVKLVSDTNPVTVEADKGVMRSVSDGSTTSEQNAVDSSSIKMAAEVNKELEETSACLICLEPLAFAHNIAECSDTFCYECIKDWSEKSDKCPNCQCTFDSKRLIHSRLLDNMISTMMRLKDQESLKSYEIRVEAGKEKKKADQAKTAPTSSSAPKASVAIGVANQITFQPSRLTLPSAPTGPARQANPPPVPTAAMGMQQLPFPPQMPQAAVPTRALNGRNHVVAAPLPVQPPRRSGVASVVDLT